NRDGLGRADERATPAHGHPPDFGEDEKAVVQPRTPMVSNLGIGEGVVSSAALKTRKARRLARLYPPEKGLIGALDAQQHVLQDLGVDLCILWAGRLQVGKFRLLLVVAGTRALPALPPGLALLQGAVVERPTAPQDRLQRLLLGW